MNCAHLALSELADTQQELLCNAFFDEVYCLCFGKPDEMESPVTWLPLLRTPPHLAHPRLEIIICGDNLNADAMRSIAGGIVFEYYRDSDCWLCTYLAVKPDCRRRGFATHLVEAMIAKIGGAPRSSSPWLLLAESENPARLPIGERQVATQRLLALSSLGFRRLPLDYVQPALSPEKAEVTFLSLIAYCDNRNGLLNTIDSSRIERFLREFFALLDQSNASSLQTMIAKLNCDQKMNPERLMIAARYDTTLGDAAALSARLTYFTKICRDHAEDGGEITDIPVGLLVSGSDAEPIPAQQREAWSLLSEEFKSFHNDIIIPSASASGRPAIVQCEAFRGGDAVDPSTVPPRLMSLTFNGPIEISWEEAPRLICFDYDDSPYTVELFFVDMISIFESGYLGYSVSFFPTSPEPTPLVVQILLAISSQTKTAGKVIKTPITINFDGKDYKCFDSFLADRIAKLEAATYAHNSSKNIFSLLKIVEKYNTEQARYRGGLLKAIHSTLLNLHRSGSTTRRPDKFASFEIVGATKHDQILSAVHVAKQRNAIKTNFTVRLSGLAQNVLDFEEQDISEIHDSLVDGVFIGSDVAFAHTDVTIRFSRESRAFQRMLPVIGGEPYWFLVEISLAHNATLLANLYDSVQREQCGMGLGRFLESQIATRLELDDKIGRETVSSRLRLTQQRRIALAHYLPNIFRYDTERRLFDSFSECRRMDVQLGYFNNLEAAIEKMTIEASALNTLFFDADKRQFDDLRNDLLIFIGVIQTTGIFLALSAIFATVAAVDPNAFSSFWKKLTLSQPFLALISRPQATSALFPMIIFLGAGFTFFLASIALFKIKSKSAALNFKFGIIGFFSILCVISIPISTLAFTFFFACASASAMAALIRGKLK